MAKANELEKSIFIHNDVVSIGCPYPQYPFHIRHKQHFTAIRVVDGNKN